MGIFKILLHQTTLGNSEHQNTVHYICKKKRPLDCDVLIKTTYSILTLKYGSVLVFKTFRLYFIILHWRKRSSILSVRYVSHYWHYFILYLKVKKYIIIHTLHSGASIIATCFKFSVMLSFWSFLATQSYKSTLTGQLFVKNIM